MSRDPTTHRSFQRPGDWLPRLAWFAMRVDGCSIAGSVQPPRSNRSLLTALVFGDRKPALRDTSDDFIHSGTTHILASNGARIAMLAGIVYLLLRLMRLPPRLTLIAVTTVITLFGVLTLPLAQAIRPIVVFLAVGFGLLGNRPAAPVQLLALAALALLVFNPQDLYGAGFQLSFVIVLGLILLTRPFLDFLGRLSRTGIGRSPNHSSRRPLGAAGKTE